MAQIDANKVPKRLLLTVQIDVNKVPQIGNYVP